MEDIRSLPHTEAMVDLLTSREIYVIEANPRSPQTAAVPAYRLFYMDHCDSEKQDIPAMIRYLDHWVTAARSSAGNCHGCLFPFLLQCSEDCIGNCEDFVPLKLPIDYDVVVDYY
ncbi:hypothetical protein TNCV_2234981 [Trichonephila clavipes]|nr:hypothetical protein TNCV_2234981 [Trichonephila clavipes]